MFTERIGRDLTTEITWFIESKPEALEHVAMTRNHGHEPILNSAVVRLEYGLGIAESCVLGIRTAVLFERSLYKVVHYLRRCETPVINLKSDRCIPVDYFSGRKHGT